MRNTRKYFGFTLVEILVVIAVMAILATLVIGLGKRLIQQARESLAKRQIEIIVAALEKYEDINRNMYPLALRVDPAAQIWYLQPELETDMQGTVASGTSPDGSVPDEIPYESSEWLYYNLNKFPGCRNLLEPMNESLKTIKGMDNKDREFTFDPPVDKTIKLVRFIDPWGNALVYEYIDTMSFPRITSAGVDGQFGTGDDITNK